MRRVAGSLATFLLILAPVRAEAAPAAASLAVRDSFPIGSSGVSCTAQGRLADPALRTMFDRGYAILCRDAAQPIGRLYAMRGKGGDPAAALTARRAGDVACDPARAESLISLGRVERMECRLKGAPVGYHVYSVARGGTLYVAEGLAGYDSALRLGLRSIVADRAVPGEIAVAATEAGDPAAFARVQAGTLDPDRALAEGYARNNEGSYAESAEFFDALSQRGPDAPAARASEYLANQALQQSNLGYFGEADALFGRAAAALDPKDAVATRQFRNFRAIHLLNQRKQGEALAELARPVPAISAIDEDEARLAQGYIDPPVSRRLNSDDAGMARMSGVDGRLTPAERAQLLDAQALFLRGAALRGQRRFDEAETALQASLAALGQVRDGQVASMAWLRAAVATEQAALAEATGRADDARRLYAAAVRIEELAYPQSASLLGARARLAAYEARAGHIDEALALYRAIVAESARVPGASGTIRPLLRPYFALLADRSASDPQAVADFFLASQILSRPGVAQTQAVLARELSGGSDEAAEMFRQSLALSREIVRLQAEIGRLAALTQPTAQDAQSLAAARRQMEERGREQTGLLARLGQYPRYRALAPDTLALADLQAKLGAQEAYYKLVLIDDDAYGLLIGAGSARLFRIAMGTAALGETVARIRDSIVVIENGHPATYPFDVDRDRALSKALLDPIAADLPAIRHLVFEPDGPMLQLPATLLIVDQAGVDRYDARTKDPKADAFDYRGIAWLGRDRMVTTAVAPQAFLDVRAIAPSRGRRPYLGMGQNAIPEGAAQSFLAARPARDCDWPIAAWANPISSAELFTAGALLGARLGDILTQAAFSDTALLARKDLADYRVLHFATHGLVTAPRPECPARPALLTSFGGPESDGLLSFKEIFDLKLDADAIILSACDTAGMATISATREAGIATGGNYALDGLVRAFVAAGGRTVIASHWPVPDDYGATKRLIGGLFSQSAAGDMPMGEAMRRSQVELMDDPDTSHPYYWAAFAIVGDSAKTISRAGTR